MATKKYIFITAYIDNDLYGRCVVNNPHIKDNAEIKCAGFNNTKDNKHVSVRYNQFLDSWNYDDEAWFIFCHSDWELLEDMTPLLAKLNRGAIYGPIGAVVKKRFGKIINECRGYCRERSRDGSESRILSCKKQRTGTIVDTLDAQSMIIHSSLVKKYGLRFDESFAFDLYCEDFSAWAKMKYGIKTRILRIECRHNNIAKNMDGRDDYYRMLDIFNEKYPDIILGSTVTVLGKINKPFQYIFPRIIES
jgi:hypothetical protein